MKRALAVAVLDLRRLWMPVGALGVGLGIFPGLTRGLGAHTTTQDTLPFVFGAAALVAGASFGLDFGEGKPSFFFARPVSTPAIFAGRIAALLGLTVVASVGFQSSHWLTGLLWQVDPMPGIRRIEFRTMAVVWTVSLFFALAAAAHTRQRAKTGFRDIVLGLMRLVGVLGLTALMVGCLMDVTMRAYDSATPVRVVMVSYVVAAFLTAVAAIASGRTNRLRIMEVLSVGTYLQTGLVFAVVLAAWAYLLHPGPSSIRGITHAFSSPDGRSAYVAARVDRGASIFQPRFQVDLTSGEVRRVDRGALSWTRERLGVWHSRDGATQVWTDQTPMLFRNARQFLTQSSPFHFQSPFGTVRAFALPDGIDLALDWELVGFPVDILPSSSGEVFAVSWRDRAGPHLAFMSPSRGQLSVIDPSAGLGAKRAWAFLPSGQLRAAFQQSVDRAEALKVVDIDPVTGRLTTVASAATGSAGQPLTIRIDESATRALVVSGPPEERKVSLMTLEASPQPATRTLATAKQINIEASLLADGRVVVIVRQPPAAELQLFSPEGEPLLSVPLGDGFTTLGNEPFANVLMVSTLFAGKSFVTLIDMTDGKVLRRIDGVRAPSLGLFGPSETPPPGSPGARILLASEKLYLLPSQTDQLRLILPR